MIFIAQERCLLIILHLKTNLNEYKTYILEEKIISMYIKVLHVMFF